MAKSILKIFKAANKSKSSFCYLCGRESATNPLDLASSFTGHNQAKCPYSKHLCDCCHSTIDGDQKQLWYWNENKKCWSKLWGRSLSRLYVNDKLIVPTIKGYHTEGEDTLLIVKDLATRALIRDWLINPPKPKFKIVIVVSGKKHILHLAQDGYSQNSFPVQFESDSLIIHLLNFRELIKHYERLMEMGFNKSEIDTGDYRADKLHKVFGDEFFELETYIDQQRGTILLQLVSFVAQSVNTQDLIYEED